MRKLTLFVVFWGFLLGGCAQLSTSAIPSALPLQPPQVSIVSPTPEPTLTATATARPSATPTLFPMSIAAMRAGQYPGSEITIVKELAMGSNYRRYYAYYLSEGYKIYALLTIPGGDMPEGGWPGIVFNHGYIPPDVYQTTAKYIEYVNQIALKGYVVFRIDYRGHDQSEGPATGAYGDPGYQVDVLNAVAALKGYEKVNPEKIGMWGHSMGGYLTLRGMVINKDIKAGVIWAGVVASYPDMLYNWRRGSSSSFTPQPSTRGWRGNWATQFGSPEDNPDFWNSVSANSFLADLSGPIQLHHGTKDDDVPFEFSETLETQIKAAGGTVELYTYKDDNHNLNGFFTTAMRRTIAFFDEYVKK